MTPWRQEGPSIKKEHATNHERPSTSLPGTRPEGASDERQVSARVREMFTRIAPRYDLLNHLLSFSFDRIWRRRTAHRVRHILARPDARVLDLCCGTGDLAFHLHGRGSREAARAGQPRGAQIIGSDFAHPMLTRARQKAVGATRGVARGRASGSPLHDSGAVTFAEADAMQLPFADSSFDLVTNAFGFRNLANYEAGLREVRRVLKPGGTVAILEFAAPEFRPFRAVYDFYFHQLVPRIGGAISGNREAYSYLPVSVSKFPSPAELREMMARVGFADARSEAWMFGAVGLHLAQRE